MKSAAMSLALLLTAAYGSGEVLRVPSEYGTIQFALAGVTDGDTILLAAGIYVESLVAPPLEFVMKGETTIDSQAAEFSIIDPTDLPGSDTLRCLTLTGGKAEFENIVFRNRNGMTEGRLTSNPSGVRGDTTVREATFTRCIFDSVVSGVSQIERIVVRNCRFIGSIGSAVYTGLWRGRVVIDSTWFDGVSGNLVSTGRGGLITNSLFTHRTGFHMFHGLGDSVIVRNCHFLGLDTLGVQGILIRPRCGSEVTDCLFENIRYGGSGIVEVTDSCFHQEKDWNCIFEFKRNRFVGCGSRGGSPNSGGEMLYIRCHGNDQGYIASLDSNVIDSTYEVRGWTNGILLRASAEINETFFTDNLTPFKSQIAVIDRSVRDTVYIRVNSFSREYDGVSWVIEGNSLVDARQNWWGHESGPYHPQNNPQGQGARVDDGIQFNPWLLSDPDTSTHGDTTESVEPEIDFAPEQYSIRAFPNPFNAVTALEIEVARAGEYEVVLYDVTGRVAANVFRGRIEHSQRLSVDAAGLSSGVYFARLSGSEGALAVGKVLLLK